MVLVNYLREQPIKESPSLPNRKIKLTLAKKVATVDGTDFQLLEAPYISNSRTLIPLRFVSEHLRANVNWDNNSRTITITDSMSTLLLKAGSRQVSVNGKLISIDVAPEIVRGTTFVPLRFATEHLNGQVIWNSSERSITISRLMPLIQGY
jgi:hypothetical protein